jgi:hypothetical protein
VENDIENTHLLAMVICDQIIREERTRKVSLIGLFGNIYAPGFPAVHSRVHIYIAVTGFSGINDCEVKFTDNASKEIVKLSGKLDFRDKHTVLEVNFRMDNIPIPSAGTYHFDLVVAGNVIGRRKIYVRQIKEQK